MTSISIIGAGIAGLHLALFLQQHGIALTLYSDRTPDQFRASRLPNTVGASNPAAYASAPSASSTGMPPNSGHTRSTSPSPALPSPSAVTSPARPALSICASTRPPCWRTSPRGGQVVGGAIHPSDMARLGQRHALVVIATGRGRLAELFPPLAAHSPYAQPQRLLCAGFFRGITPLAPLSLAFTISPGHGEIFNATFASFEGLISNLLIEAIPGGCWSR